MAKRKPSCRKPKKLTPNQQAWKKEERRIKRFLKSATARGYDFSGYTIPTQPQRITKKQLDLIKRQTPSFIYSKATYTDPTTGSTVPGTQGRTLERRRAALAGRSAASRRKKAKTNEKAIGTPDAPKQLEDHYFPAETDIVLGNIEDAIRQWEPDIAWSPQLKQIKMNDMGILQSILNGAIRQFGRDEVAERLQGQASEALELLDVLMYAASGGGKIEYSSGRNRAQSALVRLASILKGETLTTRERAMYSEMEIDDGDSYEI